MARIKSFDVDRWSEPNKKKIVKHIGMRTKKEIFDMLTDHLKRKNLLPDEYFLYATQNQQTEKELPDYDFALCTPNYGGSEGIYLDIVLMYCDAEDNRQFMRFATGKTLDDSADAFFRMSRIAAECSLLLNGRGCSYQQENVEFILRPEEALYLKEMVEEKMFEAEDKDKRTLSKLLDHLRENKVSVKTLFHPEKEIFSLRRYEIPDFEQEHFLKNATRFTGELEDVMNSIPVNDKNNLYLLEQDKAPAYSLFTCAVKENYYDLHEFAGSLLVGTRKEICKEIQSQD